MCPERKKIEISHIDHIVLTVRDIETSVKFYETILGMNKVQYGEDRVALKFGSQKLNLHKFEHEHEPKAETPMPGSADLCFISNTPIEDVINQAQNCGVKIIEGPVSRTGARGKITSIYFRDPDNNLIEVANE
jgi:catechol 2,3-dioxygenase-like lactoylglutathione lyase family enzyme